MINRLTIPGLFSLASDKHLERKLQLQLTLSTCYAHIVEA